MGKQKQSNHPWKLQTTMKTNTIVLVCLLVLALAAMSAEAARGDNEGGRGSPGRGSGYGGSSGGRGGGYYDEEEEAQSFGRGGRPNYPAKIEPEVTKVVKKCGEDSLKIKFQWDFFVFLKRCPTLWTQSALAQASMAA